MAMIPSRGGGGSSARIGPCGQQLLGAECGCAPCGAALDLGDVLGLPWLTDPCAPDVCVDPGVNPSQGDAGILLSDGVGQPGGPPLACHPLLAFANLPPVPGQPFNVVITAAQATYRLDPTPPATGVSGGTITDPGGSHSIGGTSTSFYWNQAGIDFLNASIPNLIQGYEAVAAGFTIQPAFPGLTARFYCSAFHVWWVSQEID